MIQRALEASGVATTSIVNLRPRAERLRVPRAVVVRFPRGATVGAPHDAAQQRRVLTAAFSLVETADTPHTVVDLEERFRPPEAGATQPR